ncbi:MAG: phage terminase large subunit [Candidatus Bathyarchaeota archaeon]|jgi:phage FluMu gp28-like protein|nr:phage terminase large subunit [Candidatus Bathyarchaeota archaeon]
MSTQALKQLAQNPVLFAEQLLGFKPFPYQKQMLADQSARIVACMGRQTGKTTTIAAKAIHYAFTHPNTTTLIISPSLRQSMIMFDKIQAYLTNPALRKSVTRKTRTIIQLTNKSQIIALPCSEHLLRGYTANLTICDEAAFMPETIITEIIFPMLSTTHGTAIFLSTPWDKNHFFYKAFTNPNYKTYTIKSEQNPLITKEFLQEMQQNMTQEAYQREYEAQFTEAQASYFPQQLIRKAVELAQKLGLETITNLEQPIQQGNYNAGLDLGKLQDHSALAIVNQENTTTKLIYIHQFPLNTPYTNVIGHLAKANQTFNPQKTLIDQTGIGEPILEETQNQKIPNTQGIKFTQETKQTLLTNLKLTMEQNRLAIPYHPQLCEQINNQQYTYTKNGQLQFTCPPNTHDDMLWALALACYATKTEPTPKLWIVTK